MPKILALLAVVVLLASCASHPTAPAGAVTDLAPTGRVRAAINFGNPILMALPRGRLAGQAYLTEFVARMKSSGFVAQALARHGIEAAAVAP